MSFFKRKIHPANGEETKLRRFVVMFSKCVIMVGVPILPTAIGSFLWYHFLYQRGVFFDPKLEGILSAGLIPSILGLSWALGATATLNSVLEDNKKMIIAVKVSDIETFMKLRDQSIHPLLHTLMLLFSAAIVGGFMGFKYPDASSGFIVVSTSLYFVLLVFSVVVELDDPTSGLWYIKGIPDQWLRINIDKWRHFVYQQKREELVAHLEKFTLIIGEEESKK